MIALRQPYKGSPPREQRAPQAQGDDVKQAIQRVVYRRVKRHEAGSEKWGLSCVAGSGGSASDVVLNANRYRGLRRTDSRTRVTTPCGRVGLSTCQRRVQDWKSSACDPTRFETWG